MSNLALILFWLAFVFVLYTYIGYPVLIALLARSPWAKTQTDNDAPPEPAEWPSIALIIPVNNEAHRLPVKLESLGEIDYPRDKISITFVSDGSEDETNAILEKNEIVNLVAYHPRAGKPTALNRGAENQTADILVFTDARQTLAKDAVKKLVARLLLPGIGAVSGELVHYEAGSSTSQNVGLYWRYEKWIRENESQFNSVAGVTGALYAIYRKDFHLIPEDTLLDDFEIPMHVLEQRKRVLFEAGAVVYDYLQEDTEKEKTRKIRTLTGNFQSFARNLWLFSPSKNPIWLQFLSHKVFRLYVPYALILMVLTTFLIHHWFYQFAFWGQVIFYGLAIASRHSKTLRGNRWASFANVFLELNIAAVYALMQYSKNSADVKWERTA
jgi:cellulose synthase/poly-beta-1,6-N-acetylglucosamine synthase-like glycosyltransferase